MTVREKIMRGLSSFWGSALFLGGLWAASMIAFGYVVPAAGGVSGVSIITKLMGGLAVGIFMAGWLRRRRERQAGIEAPALKLGPRARFALFGLGWFLAMGAVIVSVHPDIGSVTMKSWLALSGTALLFGFAGAASGLLVSGRVPEKR